MDGPNSFSERYCESCSILVHCWGGQNEVVVLAYLTIYFLIVEVKEKNKLKYTLNPVFKCLPQNNLSNILCKFKFLCV